VVRVTVGVLGRQMFFEEWWRRRASRGQAPQLCTTTEQQQQAQKQQPSISMSIYTRPIARFLVGNGPFKCPYVMPICKAADAAGGGALVSRAPPALLCVHRPARLGAVACLLMAPTAQLQASAGLVRARLPMLSAVALQCFADADRVPGLAPSCTTALAAGGSDAPRAPSFPRKKSLTRTTY
jgi:hypothetical protein